MPERIRHYKNVRPVDQPKKLPNNVIEFPDVHAAIDGLLDAWLPRLIESNEILIDALLRVRKLYLPGAPEVAAERVLAEVELALEKAVRARNGL
jgi:hypothetical protein